MPWWVARQLAVDYEGGRRGREEPGILGRRTRSREQGVKMNTSMPVGLSETQIGPFHSLIKEFQIFVSSNRWIFFTSPKVRFNNYN